MSKEYKKVINIDMYATKARRLKKGKKITPEMISKSVDEYLNKGGSIKILTSPLRDDLNEYKRDFRDVDLFLMENHG